MPPPNSGVKFERDVASRLHLDLVPGSGNQWHSKLDVKGRLTRWSLKFTKKDRYSLKQSDIDEMVTATQGISGDGRIPLMLIRLAEPKYDLVVICLEDFLALQETDVDIVDIPNKKSNKRKALANIPALFRKQDAEQTDS